MAGDFGKNPSGLVETIEDENREESTDAEMVELRRRLLRLHQCEDHICINCIADMEYIEGKYYGDKQKMAGVLLEFGWLELFRQIWAKNFRECVEKLQASSDGTSIVPYNKDFAFKNQRKVLSLSCNLVISLISSEIVCSKIIEMKLHNDLLSYIRNDQVVRLLGQNYYRLRKQVRQLLIVLYRVVQVVPEARELYRQEGIVDVLKKFRTFMDRDISVLSLMFLAWVVNEDENTAIDSGEEVFQYLFERLQCSLIYTPHRSNWPGNHTATEILEVIKKLTAHDANKERVIQTGGLPILAKFLQPNFVKDEQCLTVEIIWTLAYKCAGDIIKEESCVKCLESLLEIKEVDDSIKRLARGALVTLGVISQNHARSSPSGRGSGNEGESSKRQIFISYDHGSKEIVFRIRDHLRQHGLSVSIDADETSGSFDEDTTEAIDGSSVVLVCLSQKYYESPSCRKEVTYADDTKKKIIPVTVESKYKPQGWLQLRLSDKLQIDFSQSQAFEESLKTLLQRL